jgi:oligopeptide/dipeptide ABC transporter ATP-binding protein
MSDATLLEVRDLVVTVAGAAGLAGRRVVDGVDLALERGQCLALVGESGAGKTMTALALLDVLPGGARATGRILLEGRDLASLAPSARRRVNGSRIALVFQEAASAFDPVYTVGEQIAEGLRLHAGMTRRQAWTRAVELLEEVGVAGAAERAHARPHELSGGQRQRAMIAMAIAPGPALLVADEPTSALDATLRIEILELLARLQATRGMALLVITHDLGVVAELAERVAVMYAGRVVEEAPVEALFARPAHPYTAALLRARPRLAGPPFVAHAGTAIPGQAAEPGRWPAGCRFHPRCNLARERCARELPPLLDVNGAEGMRRSACFFAEEVR